MFKNMKDTELRIGINVGKTSHADRGITIYTRNILREFGQIGGDCRFVLMQYPEKSNCDNFGIVNAEQTTLPYSDEHSPAITIVNEQLINPVYQMALNLDVVWHPHNRSQLLTPTAYVCTMHDIQAITRPELTGLYLDSIARKILYKSRAESATHADVIITPSEYVKREVVSQLNISPNKVVAIPHGIDKSVFTPQRNGRAELEIKNKYALPEKYLLTVGSYAPHKNLKVFVDAYAQSNLPKAGVDLVMCGPNDASGYKRGYEQIITYVKKLGLLERLKFLTAVPLEDLAVIYRCASIFAITSLSEGFGFTPLEAMASGVPVVASNSTAIPEVCGYAALYADPNNPREFAEHFNNLLDDNKAKERLVANGRTQVTKFDWQIAANRTLEVLCSAAMARK